MVKRQSAEFWEQHLEEWRQSGLTQVAYCASHGLHIKSFYRWRRKERNIAQPDRLTLVPVSLGSPATNGCVQIHSPGGWRIELPAGGTSWLADLLRQLP